MPPRKLPPEHPQTRPKRKKRTPNRVTGTPCHDVSVGVSFDATQGHTIESIEYDGAPAWTRYDLYPPAPDPFWPLLWADLTLAYGRVRHWLADRLTSLASTVRPND